MKFPDNISEQIKVKGKNKIEIIMLNGDTEEVDKNLRLWTVISADSTIIEISLDFERPAYVSSGFDPDLLFIQVFMS